MFRAGGEQGRGATSAALWLVPGKRLGRQHNINNVNNIFSNDDRGGGREHAVARGLKYSSTKVVSSSMRKTSYSKK